MKGKRTVHQQGDTWQFAIYLGVEDGKRKYLRKGGFLTQREAQKAMREILNSMDNGSFVQPAQMTVGAYLAEWLEEKATMVRLGTMRKYKWMINYLIVPVLGPVPLQSLTPQHVQSFYNSLRTGDKPLSLRSTLHVHRILHQALDRALQRGVVGRNVAAAVETPKAKKSEIKAWTREEATAFLNLARLHRYYVAFALALETGMRQGEILALKWSDVDLEGAKLHVKRADSFGHTLELVSGRRIIPITSSIIQVLRTHKTTQAEKARLVGHDYQDHDLVIAKQDGSPLRSRSLDNHWYQLLKDSRLPVIRFHDLRHTYGRQLIEACATPSEQSILDMYAHVYRPSREDSAQRFESFLHSDIDD